MSEKTTTIRKRCGCCGELYEVTVPELPTTAGAGELCDLDQRPAPPLRNAMYSQIFRCPRCGFTVGPKMRVVAEDFVLESDYITCEGNNFPEGTGADYYRLGMTSEHERDLVNSFEAFLRAAWAFDDAGDEENARKCRDRCIAMNKALPGKNSYDYLVRADIFRRAGRFAEFPDEIKNRHYPDGLTNMIMKFQSEKAAEGDTKAYTMKDCFDRFSKEK
ncbi:MAG: hypothetical protein K6B74_10485 [Ruminococcus sp.]|nr:hypothetical protein [Ruminococcus sp.]